jgi:hypothetical protein
LVRNERFFLWTLIFSLGLVALGVGSVVIEVARARRRRDSLPERFVSPRRTIRRLFTSAVLVALGVMILLGVHFLPFSQPGIHFLAYWGIIFLLAAWLFLCPIFDIRETRRIYRSRMRHLADQTRWPAATPTKPLPSNGQKRGRLPEQKAEQN